MKKNNKGFTLVEVIVVAIIVAILAAVAVPLYLNYVTNSRNNAAANAAGAVATFCGACVNASGSFSGFNSGTKITAAQMIYCNSTSMGSTSSHILDNVDITITTGDPGSVIASHQDAGAGNVPSTFNF